MNPLVSIIIPCYNAERFVDETIQSVFSQSYSNWEIIAVNDGSTDNTLSILSKYNDGRIKLINQQNMGVSNARNNGVKLASGEYLIFLDADDILSGNFIQRRIDLFQQHAEINFIGSIVKVFKSTIQDILKTQISIVADIKRDVLLYLPHSTTTPSSYMFKADIFKDIDNIFNPELSSTADRYFLLEHEARLNGTLCDDQEACLYYRVSDSSMSTKMNGKLVDDNEKFYQLLKSNIILSDKDAAYLRKGYYILYRSNLKIMRPIRAARYFLRLLFS